MDNIEVADKFDGANFKVDSDKKSSPPSVREESSSGSLFWRQVLPVPWQGKLGHQSVCQGASTDFMLSQNNALSETAPIVPSPGMRRPHPTQQFTVVHQTGSVAAGQTCAHC